MGGLFCDPGSDYLQYWELSSLADASDSAVRPRHLPLL